MVSIWVWRGHCGGVRTPDPASLLLRQVLLHFFAPFFSPSRPEPLPEATPNAAGSYPSAPKGLLSSPRPPPLPSVPRDRGEAPYKEQSRRGAQPSCHPGLAGLRRPKRGGPECLGLVGSVLQAERLSCQESQGGMRAPFRLRRLDPAALKTHTWAPPNFGFEGSGAC